MNRDQKIALAGATAVNRLQAIWQKWHQPHTWSGIIGIPPQEYRSGNVFVHSRGRRFKMCERCGITDSTSHYWKYCRPWRVNYLDKRAA